MHNKALPFLLVIILLASSCSSPKETASKKSAPTLSPADALRGGTSFSNAVVIGVKSEREGRDEEYRWLANNFPGYTLIKKSHVKRSTKKYDILRIRTRDGQLRNVYFDSTSFSR